MISLSIEQYARPACQLQTDGALRANDTVWDSVSSDTG
jgi:hypothetical protein